MFLCLACGLLVLLCLILFKTLLLDELGYVDGLLVEFSWLLNELLVPLFIGFPFLSSLTNCFCFLADLDESWLFFFDLLIEAEFLVILDEVTFTELCSTYPTGIPKLSSLIFFQFFIRKYRPFICAFIAG